MGEQLRRGGRRARFGGLAGIVVLSSLLTACEKGTAGPLGADDGTPGTSSSRSASQGSDSTTRTSGDASYAVDAPGRFKPPLRTADLLVTASHTLPDPLVTRIRRIQGVRALVPFSYAAASVDGRTLTVAAADPAAFRVFTPDATAQAQFVWDRLAGGEAAVDVTTPKKLVDAKDMVRLGSRDDSPLVHVGAYAPLVQRAAGLSTRPVVQVVVNPKRGEQLGLPTRNALLISTGSRTPSLVKKQIDKLLAGDRAGSVQLLAREFDNALQTAVLAGTSVSDAIGTFSYTNGPDGTIKPDQRWVDAYIRTESVPLLGDVTCNKAFIPQLRAALTEIVQAGLASSIHPDEYAGCYYPRYIGRSAANGLSLHSWGIAVDLNVPGNQRGTSGEMDRRVVAIMKKWGMAWGGDWNYTDPMHFEMNRVVRPG
ncbi:M15 family metallopeptidase [Nocardioides marmoribigeumensis]|jgi:hypothetical protein|uniref:Peptidase M15C domain-containing protein n=1 Tax=Nocardioides marmoribigeumensis TaxID=433649 RepID=A0ABU2BUZ1_9ACTN|nr:M15 family metallopeptidase [Nocardioides marmoribigeumensis]MDR7362447.1 hypothetical protein [Nocardioides marmoribigeumensis]